MKRETRRSRAWVLLCVSAALLTIACRGASTEEVFVFAAASTTDALQEIAREYKGQTGAMVIFSFGSSSTLAKQIVAGGIAEARVPVAEVVNVKEDHAQGRLHALHAVGLAEKHSEQGFAVVDAGERVAARLLLELERA